MIGNRIISTSGLGGGIPLDYILAYTSHNGTTTLIDEKGYNAVRVTNPPVFSAGKITLNAENQYLKTSVGVPFNSPILTISLKVNLTNAGSSKGIIATLQPPTYTNAFFIYTNGNDLGVNMYGDSIGRSYFVTGAVGAVRHYIIELNKTTWNTTVWNNTGVVGSVNGVGTPGSANFTSWPLWFGTYPLAPTTSGIRGDIFNKTRIYNRVLTATERAALFAEGLT